MPLADYLTVDRVVLLQARDRAAAIAELAHAAVADLPGLDASTVSAAVLAREEGLHTCITPGIALPHARLEGVHQALITVGVSRRGIAWGGEGQVAHLVVMLLGIPSAADEHLRMLAEVAHVVRQEGVLRDVIGASDTADIYRQLVRAQRGGDLPADEPIQQVNRTLVSRAVDLAEDLGASVVMIYADDKLDLSFVSQLTPQTRLLLASPHLRKHDACRAFFDGAFEVPFARCGNERLFEVALLLAMSEGLIESQDSVVCTWGRPESGRLDSLSVVDMARSFEVLLSLRSELVAGDVNHQVLNRVLSLATSLGREGREGKSVGALFVIGNYDRVLAHCRQMVMNPFRGYDADLRSILDPSLEETIKEFAVIDGAFILQGDGIVMSAGTHLAVPPTDLDLSPGLGARHAAAAGITRAAGALAVTVSESTGTVSLYARGEAILVLQRATP